MANDYVWTGSRRSEKRLRTILQKNNESLMFHAFSFICVSTAAQKLSFLTFCVFIFALA